MLIKLTPPSSPSPTPTILFALAFPDPPANLPLPPAWALQLARLAADDLEAPPALHALDRAAAFPSLLSEVLFDLPRARVACAFLDGAAEEWDLGPRCAEMLARVIRDVEESGRAEERAREWQRAIETERARAEREVGEREREMEMEKEKEKERAEREREAELEREYEEKMQSLKAGKGKAKAQSLNSPPAPSKGAARPKGRLHRSKSLLMALVASFSSPSTSSSSSSSSSPPSTPASAPATRTSFSTTPRAASPLRVFARRASFSALSSIAKGDSTSTSSDSPPPSPRSRSRPSSPPAPPTRDSDPFQNLETPPSSAPPSAPSSAFSTQQQRARPRHEAMSPRALRRRARSTLVDAFRAHVLPQLGARVGLFEPSGSTPLAPPYLRLVDDEYFGAQGDRARARGGGYHAWVTCSMLRRAEARMHELEAQWPALARAARLHRHEKSASGGSDTFSPVSIGFPVSPTSPRQAAFEPWSSDEESASESGSDTDGEGSEGGSEGGTFGVPGGRGGEDEEDDEDDSDGSSVHTPESGHSIGYGHPARKAGGGGHVQDVSSSSTSSYFTCADDEEGVEHADDEPKPTVSHIRGAAHASEHSRSASGNGGHGRNASERSARREQRERRHAGRTARAEHMAFVKMTARLRRVLAQGAAARGGARVQRAEGERVREGRGVRRAWLDKKAAGATGPGGRVVPVQAFRPSGLRSVWDAKDAEAEAESAETDQPPAYEDVVLHIPMRRTRPSPPLHRAHIHKALAHLEELEREDNTDFEAALEGLDDIEVDLEHLELSDALDIDGMALAVDGDFDDELGLDVFADVGGGKGRPVRGRRVPVPMAGKGKVQGLREVWERRRVAAAI